jgi:hypothetical protein
VRTTGPVTAQCLHAAADSYFAALPIASLTNSWLKLRQPLLTNLACYLEQTTARHSLVVVGGKLVAPEGGFCLLLQRLCPRDACGTAPACLAHSLTHTWQMLLAVGAHEQEQVREAAVVAAAIVGSHDRRRHWGGAALRCRGLTLPWQPSQRPASGSEKLRCRFVGGTAGTTWT